MEDKLMLSNEKKVIFINFNNIKNKCLVDCLVSYYSNLNHNTRLTYTAAINDFCSFLSIGINEIIRTTKKNIFQYKKQLKHKGHAVSTINLKLTALRTLFSEVAKIIRTFNNPFDRLTRAEKNQLFGKVEKKVKKDSVISTGDYKKMVEYLDFMYAKTARIIYCRNRIILEIYYKTGLRASEFVNCRKKDIDKINNVYYLKINGKGNKQRSVMISEDLYNRIAAYNIVVNNDTEYLLVKESRKKFHREEISRTITRLAKKVLKKNISVHTLRHAFATEMIKRKKSLTAVSNYLGHETTAITADMYIHDQLSIEDIKELEN